MKIKNIVLGALLLGAALLAATVQAGSTLPEPCLRSTLCRGLIEVYEFEEASDTTRFGALMAQLYEPQGQNVGNAAGKPSSAVGNPAELALDLPGSTSLYLWANGGGGIPTTTSFWFYLDTALSDGQLAYVYSRKDSARPGPEILLWNETGANPTKMCTTYWNIEGNATNTTCSTATINTATWYHVVTGIGMAKNGDGVPVGGAAYVSVNGASKSFNATPIGFDINPGDIQVRIGNSFAGAGPESAGSSPFDGRLDQLVFWGRELTNSEITLLYNGGYRFPYPFVTE